MAFLLRTHISSILLLSLSAKAQLPVVPLQTFRAASATFPLPGGIAFRWRASDLTSSPVSIWTDEIQGYNWVQATGGNQPTWVTNDGVHFASASSQFFTATNANVALTAATNCYLIVHKFTTLAAFMTLFDNTLSGTITHGIDGTGSAFYIDAGLDDYGPVSSGHIIDFLWADKVSGTYHTLTNGVQGPAITSATDYHISRVGRQPGGSFFNGVLYEYIVWTNSGNFSSAEIAQIHAYCTNTYGFTP